MPEKRLLVFVLCSKPRKPEYREKIERLKHRYFVQLYSYQDIDVDGLKRELDAAGQEEAYFAPIGPVDEWELVIEEMARGHNFVMTLVLV
jgi:hypothetical protein